VEEKKDSEVKEIVGIEVSISLKKNDEMKDFEFFFLFFFKDLLMVWSFVLCLFFFFKMLQGMLKK
jgi:hypothetical protein